MYMKTANAIIILASIALSARFAWSDDVVRENRGFAVDLKNAEAVGSGLSIKGTKSPKQSQETVDVLHQFDDEAIFLDVAGQDKVKWKLIREEMEDIVNGFHHRPEVMGADYDNARKMVFQVRLAKLLRNYINYAVFAVEARRLGLKVPESAYEEQRTRMRQELEKKGANGRKALARMSAPESLYEHNLTNALLWMAYADQVVRPAVQIDQAEIQERIDKQHADNLAVVATNACKKALVHDLHTQLEQGKAQFDKLAEQWSECPSSDTGGVLTDVNDVPQKIHHEDMRPEIEAAYSALKEGEVSKVVETPYSWHIIKLIKRNPATEDDEETVEIAHIMLEKVPLLPELTAEQARAKIENRKVRETLLLKFPELMKATKINCLVPLEDADSESRQKRRRKKRVIRD